MNTNTTLSKGSRIQLNQSQAARAGILLLLLLLIFPPVVQAQFNYTNKGDGTATITGYTGPGGDVAIPDTIGGLPVTRVGDLAFYNGGRPQPYTLTSVTIPDSVTSIGDWAFAWWFPSLRSVTLGKGLRTIGDGAFGACGPYPPGPSGEGLTGVYFLGDAPSLGGPLVFTGDDNTVYYVRGTSGWGPTFGGRPTAVWFPPPSAYICTTNNGTLTITGYTGPGGHVTIPDTITGLPVTSIGDSAFYECWQLTSVTIPDSVTNIGYDAFWGCSGLVNVTIGNSVTSIGKEAFDECASLTSVTIGNSVTSIEDSAFFGCTSLINVTIPNGVTNIGTVAFAGTRLTSVIIPNSVTRVGGQAFYGCNSLTNVMIPSSVTNIGEGAFWYCTSLSAITVGVLNSAYSSEAGVLFNRSQTTLIQYPEGKTGNYKVPTSVTSIGDWAFEQCGRLTGVTIPNSVTSIGQGEFDSCTSLTNVTLPNGVATIQSDTFGNCTSLASVTIPASVTYIGQYAFDSCTNLTSVYAMGNAPDIDPNNLFAGDDHATVYHLPGTTGWGTTFGGRPTALWPPPTIQTPPQTQTAEAGSAVGLWVGGSNPLPLLYLWYLNATNLIICSTNCELELTNLQFSQSGDYTVVVTNVSGAVASSLATLNVIAAVERRPVPGVKVTGEAGSLLNVDYAYFLQPAPNWTTLGSVSLISTSQYYFDPTLPLPPQRFYRAWQTGNPSVIPSLDLRMVPAITVTGNIGGSVRVDAINQFGPTDAWFTLDTVTLTNSSQLYFDVSTPGHPQRLYRLVQVP